MRVVALRSLQEFWEQYTDAEHALKAWHAEARKATWTSPAELKAHYRTASIVDRERVVFNICGNKYRLIVAINYDSGVVFVKWFGTHAKYDKIDAGNVEWTPRSSKTKPNTKPRSKK